MSQSMTSFKQTAEQEMLLFLQQINQEAVTKAADLIEFSEKHDGRVHVTGIGKPSYVAGYIASLLSSTGTSAYMLDGTEAIHGSSGQVCPGDIVIAISNSGETQELKKTVSALLTNGAVVLACSGNEESWLAKAASVHLFAGIHAEGDSLNKPPRLSIIAELLVLQMLSIELQSRKELTKDDYLKWHPGGSLGHGLRQELEGD